MQIEKISKIIYYFIIIIVSALAVLLIISAFPITGNYKLMTVRSGSMEPSIPKGSIVVVKPTDNYQIGDIITFGKISKDDIPTTHRIAEIRTIEGKYFYTTKGEANRSADIKEIAQNEIVGKVLFKIPYVGYLINIVKTPLGFAFLIIIPATIIIYDEFKKIWKEILQLKKKNEK